MTRTVPYTWRIGVDNAFGYLTRRDGTHLVESRRFLGAVGLAVSLSDGSALLTTADGQSSWQPLTPQRACELAAIPAPSVDGAAETQRRLDPFHVERHTSPVFLAIVEFARTRRLPCAHALRAWLAGKWDGTFDGPYLEQPETFAASVIERIAHTGGQLEDALPAQLLADSLEHPAVAQASGWRAALGELPSAIARFTHQLAHDRSAQQAANAAASSQLTLV
ncbi:MAG TPA: hypothetical protein VGL57_13460 [Solirubrobacteraceae bacterium]|jgi:hypothetical protein